MREVRIEEWEVINHPFTGEKCLRGKSFGHPNIEDGEEVVTSPIKKVQTQNSLYILGDEKRST